MNFKRLKTTHELNQIQLMAFSVAIFYWPWYFVSSILFPGLVDDIWGRLVISALFAAIFAYSKTSSMKFNFLQNISFLGLFLTVGHQSFLLTVNNWNHFYQVSYLFLAAILVSSIHQITLLSVVGGILIIAPFLTLLWTHPAAEEVLLFSIFNVSLISFLGHSLRANTITNKNIIELSSSNLKSAKIIALEQMAGALVHDLSRPISIIKGKSDQILVQTISDGPVERTWLRSELAKIGATVEQVSRIIRGLKAFSSGSEQNEETIISLKNWIQNTIEICQDRMNIHSIQMTVAPIDNIHFMGREAQLTQGLLNLLNNSIDALETSEVRKINIDFNTFDNKLQILITDTGPGIRDEHQSKLTEAFFTTKPPGTGTGLGLSISRGIIESHGGTLSLVASSKLTCFMIEIPIKQFPLTSILERKSS